MRVFNRLDALPLRFFMRSVYKHGAGLVMQVFWGDNCVEMLDLFNYVTLHFNEEKYLIQ